MSDSRNTDIERISRILGALSNPHRLQLFLRLASCCAPNASFPDEGGSCACVGDLAKGSNVSASTVSHHLKELFNVGLIRMERDGQRVQCRIDREVFEELMDFLRHQAGGRLEE